MSDFDRARTLFSDYERHGSIGILNESIEIIEDLIEEAGQDSQRAQNLKNAITNYIDKEMDDLLAKYNIREYKESLKTSDDPMIEILSVFSDEDIDKFIALLKLK